MLPGVLNSGQIARMFGMKQANVHVFLKRRGVEPVTESPLPIGKLYDKSAIEKLFGEWSADPRRKSDAKRKAAALANVKGGDGE